MTLKLTTFARIRKLIYEKAAIVLEEGKEYLVESRLSSVARCYGFDSVDALGEALSSNSALQTAVVDAMTTNETSFFRDHHPFEALRNQVLPELIGLRAKPRTLRVWCAACSTGQEPYSLAMLLYEHFPQLASWDVRIDATDISKAVLARATGARYSQVEVNRGLTAAQLAKYFVRSGSEWEVRNEIKRLVRFSELNLIGSYPVLERYDLVFLRNVLIYFDLSTKLSVLGKVQQHVTHDGYVVLGGSETPPHEYMELERLPIPRAGIYRVCTGRTIKTHVRPTNG